MALLEGSTPPGRATVGAIDDVYLDTTTGIKYVMKYVITLDTDRTSEKTYCWYRQPQSSDDSAGDSDDISFYEDIYDRVTNSGTNFSHMFYNRTKLQTIPLIDTSNGTDFSRMFYNTAITTIPLLNTSKGTDFSYMFYECDNLTTVPLLDTGNGTNFYRMFYVTSIKTIPLLDTSNGTNFSHMLGYCPSLTSIPLINTSNGTDFSYMFYFSKSLKTIPSLNVGKGVKFDGMFSSSNIESIPALDTSSGTSFMGMFSGAMKLETISSLNLSNSSNCNSMFYNCAALVNLTVNGCIKSPINLSYSPLLSSSSLQSVINALTDRTGSSVYTIVLGATNIAKLSESMLSLIEAKNWAYK